MAQELVTALVLFGALLAVMRAGGWFEARLGRRVKASLRQDGVQEIEIVVRGRYRPDTVVVRRDLPMRLLFHRQEDTPCSEMVIFSGFRQERWLAPFATTVVQFVPTSAGEFLFTCAMGMYQGTLVVEAPETTGRVGRLLRVAWIAGLSLLRRQWAYFLCFRLMARGLPLGTVALHPTHHQDVHERAEQHESQGTQTAEGNTQDRHQEDSRQWDEAAQ